MIKLKDLINFNYIHSSEEFNVCRFLNIQLKNNIIKDIFKSFIRLLYWIYRDIKVIKNMLFIPSKKGIFLYETLNNYKALFNVKEKISDSLFLGKNCKQAQGGYYIPRSIIIFISIFYIPILLYYCNVAEGYLKKSIKHFFIIYLETFGVYQIVKTYMFWLRPKFIVHSNGQRSLPLSFNKFCKHDNIPTFYMSHGVTDYKTNNLLTDYSFLSGIDELDKFSKNNNDIPSTVFLIGFPRFDEYLPKINKSDELKNLCVCTNLLDDVNLISKLLKFILNIFPDIELTIRPHPGESVVYHNSEKRHNYYYKLAKKIKIFFSDPYKENVYSCLIKNDAIISCDSGIHLDAALLNVFPIYFDYSKKKLDKCGFVRNNLSIYIDNEFDLKKLLYKLKKRKPNIRSRAKYYCNTIDTKYDGRSTELAANIINQVVQNGEVDLSKWRRLEEYDNVTAYEPRI